MGSKSGSSGNGGNNRGYQGPKGPVAPPSVQTKKVNKQRDARIIENTVQDITRKQISDPNRFQGSKDSKAVWNTVSMRKGNYVTDSRGRPMRTSSGQIVMTSAGRKAYDNAMRRIPLSKKQYESQKKITNILTLPLMLLPGGGLIRAGAKHSMNQSSFNYGNKVMTYGGTNLLSDEERNKLARQQMEVVENRPMPKFDLKKRKKKSLLATLLGSGEKLGTRGIL